MSVKSTLRRREFLAAGAAAGAGAMLFRVGVLSARSPNEKLNVACVGIANQGRSQVGAAAAENVVALCDIDENYLAAGARRFPKARTFCDFRKMFDALAGQIDAVMVSTADHTHAPASAMGMRLGKHCYTEKPLTRTLHECRTLIEIAQEKKLVTQMGTNIHAGDNYRRVVELIQSGAIGAVREVHVWCGKSWANGRRPAQGQPVPKHIHWDEWLGPAPERPYASCYLPANWRRYWAFGNGTLGDMACHLMDLPFWALGLRGPTTIAADGPPVDPEGCPADLRVQYEFPARGDLPPVKLTWYDGSRRPAPPAELKAKLGGMGVLFIGAAGALLADYGSRELLPAAKFAGFQPPAPSIPKSIGHHEEFFLACKTGGPTTCNFDYSGTLTEAVLLGGVAYRLGKKIEWDAANLKATNCPEAAALIRQPYRNGWKL